VDPQTQPARPLSEAEKKENASIRRLIDTFTFQGRNAKIDKKYIMVSS